MRKMFVTVAMVTAAWAVAPRAEAIESGLAIVGSPGTGTVTVTFSGLALGGLQLSAIGGISAGTLSSVSVDARLNASVADTYANDLMLYVDALPLSDSGLLQIGGFTDLLASEHHSWANGNSSAAGTKLVDSVVLANALTFSGTSADPVVYLGNGYGDPMASGTWTGSLTLNFVPAVPEPATWLLVAAGLAAVSLLARGRPTGPRTPSMSA
jgi:hypothetical protein